MKTSPILLAISMIYTLNTVSAADSVAPSQKPPNNLAVSNVPQFLIFGYDDQETRAGMQVVVDIFKQRKNPPGLGRKETFDGSPARCSFYTNTMYLDDAALKNLHKQAYTDGFEIGNHTHSHETGFNTTESTWKTEMQRCNTDLVSAGIPKAAITGFRTPFLEYNNAAFKAMVSMGFMYDCSVEEGWENDQATGRYFWPYTLDNGSPGNKAMVDLGQPHELLNKYPGLWEIPCYNVVFPHDSICEKYGISKGLRQRTYNYINYFDPTNGKLTGLDYNLMEEAKVTQKEFLGILKYNLDMNYKGNRAPMTFGCHSKYYAESGWAQVLKDFLDYALQYPDVRVVTTNNLIQWMRNPKPLDPNVTVLSDQNTAVSSIKINSLPGRIIQISGLTAGTFKAHLYTPDGKRLTSVSKNFPDGISNKALVTAPQVSVGFIIVSVQNKGVKLTRKVQLLD